MNALRRPRPSAPSLSLLSALAVLCTGVEAGAQSGASYATTLDGCNGNAVGACLAQNDVQPTLVFTTSPSDYAFPVRNTTGIPLVVLGFDFFTRSATNAEEVATSHLYRDASGPGAQLHTVPANDGDANGTITVRGFNSWWSTAVYPAPVVQPGECFWIGFNPNSRVSPPMSQNGLPGAALPVHRRPNVNGNSWVTLSLVGEPAFRLRCTTPGGPVPWLSSPDVPRVGQPFRLEVTIDQPFQPAFAVWSLDGLRWNGLSTPVNLAPLGAADCFVHTGSESALLLISDQSGVATQTAALPNSPALNGVIFFNQGASLSSANTLGFVVSNRGRGVIGL